MGVPYRHIKNQGPVISTMGQIAIMAANQKFGRHVDTVGELPGPWYEETVAARPSDLVDDFIRWSGGDTSAWRGWVPPTLFPQWGFPLLGKTLSGVPYPLAKVLNAGCEFISHQPIPRQSDLHLKARLKRIDDNGRRAIITQELLTSDGEGNCLLEAHVSMIVPLGGPKEAGQKAQRAPVCVPIGARPISDWRIPADAGLSFACLTGDFNPIHWMKTYAKIAGFGRTILHGFGSLAGAVERIRKAQWSGDVHRPGGLKVRFTRPLKLPAKVKVYVHQNDFYLGSAPGARAYLEGTVFDQTESEKG